MERLVSEGGRRLGAFTKKLKIIDYYTVPWEDCPATTPPPCMIAVRDWSCGEETSFAWHLVAEREGIPPRRILDHRVELERRTLEEFSGYVRASRKARWVHWGLRKAGYGFP